ncbi:MAG: glutamine-hydrolyzing carbamoyl-phosphate synthase small subunit [Myxococcota bacterium]
MNEHEQTKGRDVAHLALADGRVFRGVAIGASGVTAGEAVFTTGMTGYQEVLTDPSYCGQIVTMTAPHIGNTGVNEDDPEARKPFLAGFVVHALAETPSSWRATQSLDNYLQKHGIVGIAGVDTRALTRHIRDAGAQSATIGTGDPAELVERAKATAPMNGRDLTSVVTTDAPYAWTEGSGEWTEADEARPGEGLHIVCVDFGIKRNILRCFADLGCKLTVVPAQSSAGDVLAHEPDGIFLSNGPGDPSAVAHGVALAGELLGKKPLFGICLGHQLLGLALGGSTYKLKFGHRGLNQPVKDLATGRIEITTQNHGFVVDPDSLAGKAEVTHVHLNDGTCMGIAKPDAQAFAVQYHPEAAAGPHDAHYLFGRFIDAMRG